MERYGRPDDEQLTFATAEGRSSRLSERFTPDGMTGRMEYLSAWLSSSQSREKPREGEVGAGDGIRTHGIFLGKEALYP